MAKFIFGFMTLLLSIHAQASQISWEGEWTGACTLVPSYNGIADFSGSLKVTSQNSTPEQFEWQLIYDFAGRQPTETRAYALNQVSGEKDHYVIDERNGLLLDAFVNGSTLYSPFTINGLLILARYEFNGENVVIEMPTFLQAPIRKTCVNGNPSLCSESMVLQRVQRCSFFRTKSGVVK